MSLYREAGRRSAVPLIAAVAAALLLGGVIGFLLGKGSAEEPSLSEQVNELSQDAQPLRSALDLVPIEYRQGVRAGRVVSETEYQAAVATVARADASYDEISTDLSALDARATRRLARSIAQLARLVEATAPPEAVAARSGAAARQLAIALGAA